jgi:serine/threonine protein kinase
MDEHIRNLLQALRLKWDQERLVAHLAPFRLGKCLADDGRMALVYEAVGQESSREAVVKLPSPVAVDMEPGSLDDRIAALRYEASVLRGQAGNPHVVQVETDATDRDLPFLVLERLGPSLLDLIGEGQALTVSDALGMLGDVARGLEGFHRRGVCHNDIKAGNVLRGSRGWTLIDPSPPEFITPYYADDDSWRGPCRDFVALGRTFLAAWYGEERITEVPEDSPLADEPEVVRVLFRLLQYPCDPGVEAGWVCRTADALLKGLRCPNLSRLDQA